MTNSNVKVKFETRVSGSGLLSGQPSLRLAVKVRPGVGTYWFAVVPVKLVLKLSCNMTRTTSTMMDRVMSGTLSVTVAVMARRSRSPSPFTAPVTDSELAIKVTMHVVGPSYSVTGRGEQR